MIYDIYKILCNAELDDIKDQSVGNFNDVHIHETLNSETYVIRLFTEHGSKRLDIQIGHKGPGGIFRPFHDFYTETFYNIFTKKIFEKLDEKALKTQSEKFDQDQMNIETCRDILNQFKT